MTSENVSHKRLAVDDLGDPDTQEKSFTILINAGHKDERKEQPKKKHNPTSWNGFNSSSNLVTHRASNLSAKIPTASCIPVKKMKRGKKVRGGYYCRECSTAYTKVPLKNHSKVCPSRINYCRACSKVILCPVAKTIVGFDGPPIFRYKNGRCMNPSCKCPLNNPQYTICMKCLEVVDNSPGAAGSSNTVGDE